jgi:phenylalanyl-tRNA synthetase beta chain
MYVPVALPGAHLASIDLTIAERTLRGVASNGMICAQSELGIPENENTHGIWILTDDMPDIESSQIGNALQDQYPRLANTIYDVENKTITHRPDLMGHAGIARDLYATYMTHQPDAIAQHDTNTWSDYAKTSAEYLSHHETTTSIDIHTATDACSYYSLIELADVDIHTSTFHTRLQLHDLQIAPRSNRVDFSNLFMYQTGQPIHCFDMDKIVGNITVRQAKSDEIFVDLTGKQHALHPDDIVIADQSHILALAGVIGGQDSAITESTTRIAIELATFDPISVRKTAMRHQLRTDASSRYEKYIDPRYSQSCLLALRDMMTMMQADLGNTTRVGVSVSDHIALTPPRIARSETDLHKLTSSTSTEDAYGILSLLGCSHDKTSVTLPRRRSPQDLSIPADITEEVIRIAGYNQLNTAHVTQTMQHASGSPHPDLQSRIEDILTLSYDASSIETYPWISDTWINRFDLDTNYLTHLRNPLQSDHQYLADSHLYNLLDQLTHNHKFFDTLRYYTIGSVWPSTNSQDHAIAPSPINKHTLESRQLGLVLYHTQSPDDILTSHIVTARHIIDQLVGNHTIQPTNHKHFHPRQQGSVMQGDRMLGFVGRIHPLLCESLKLSPSSDVVYLTLDM